VRDADQLIAGALRDIAAEARPPRPQADAAWRAGRRRRLVAPVASAAFIAGVIALVLTVVLPQAPAPGPAAPAHTRLVSITLSPPAGAGTGVLDAATQLLGQRVRYLDLPNVQIRAFGPNVVVTGPATDEAQLKTIATPGVLNFRQVLLYQPYRGTTLGDEGLVDRPTLALFRKLACTPGNAGTWQDQVGYAVATDYDDPYAQIVACDSSGNKYALDVAYVRGAQLASATVALSSPGNQWEVLLRLNSAGASALTALTSEMYDKYFTAAGGNPSTSSFWLDTIAVVVDGNVINASEVAGSISSGLAVIPGNFTRAQAEDLTAQLRFGALPADFRITAVATFTVPLSPSPSCASRPAAPD
jgi:preprotein translocase subunit SecD